MLLTEILVKLRFGDPVRRDNTRLLIAKLVSCSADGSQASESVWLNNTALPLDGNGISQKARSKLLQLFESSQQITKAEALLCQTIF